MVLFYHAHSGMIHSINGYWLSMSLSFSIYCISIHTIVCFSNPVQYHTCLISTGMIVNVITFEHLNYYCVLRKDTSIVRLLSLASSSHHTTEKKVSKTDFLHGIFSRISSFTVVIHESTSFHACVHFIRFQFPDLLNLLKGFSIHSIPFHSTTKCYQIT